MKPPTFTWKLMLTTLLLVLIISGFANSSLTIYEDAEFYGDKITLTFQSETTIRYLEVGKNYFLLDELNTSISCSNPIAINVSAVNSGVNLSSGTTVLRFNATYTSGNVVFTFTGNHTAAIYNLYIDNTFSNIYEAGSFSFSHSSWSEVDFLVELDGYRPDPPYNGSSPYNTTYNSVNFTWNRGNRSDREIITRRNDTYTTSVHDPNSYIIYNGTDLFYNDTDVFSTRYYTAWSYNETTGYFSATGLDFIWGALGVSVFNESQANQAIPNWNMQLTNIDTEEVYTVYDQNNILWIDVLEIPNGEDISVRIWADDYYEKDWIMDLLDNHIINQSFYLPAHYIPPGGDPGGGGGDDPNETFSPQLYYIRIIDDFDQPVQDAHVDIRRYINVTDGFQSVGSFLTDGNGFGNMYLIPNVEYKAVITKTGYDDESSLWRPDPIYFGIFNPKVFRISLSEGGTETIWTNIEWNIDPTSFDVFTENVTFYFNITSAVNEIEWYSMKVMYWNETNEEWDTLYYYIEENETGGGSLSYTVYNQTGKYGVQCKFKKEDYNTYTFGTPHSEDKYIFWIWPVGSEGLDSLDDIIDELLGKSPVSIGTIAVAWTSLIAIIVATLLLFNFSTKYAGFGIIILGIVLGAFKVPLGLISDDVINFIVVVIIIFLGIITILITKKSD